MKISAFVVSYNRENLIEACLAALGFADEVILVDKSSTDRTAQVGEKWADRVVIVPWSPAPGETFGLALSLCSHDWIVALSDDECLNEAAIDFIVDEVVRPRADIYLFPRHEYILGRFEEAAYYWPEWHPQLYRKETFRYGRTVHGAPQALSDKQMFVPLESGAAVVHLSHESADQWIEKTNRYTSQRDRLHTYSDPASVLAPLAQVDGNLAAFARAAIDFWMSKSTEPQNNDYASRVAVLRAIYDMVDRVKQLEEEDHIDGRVLFAEKCDELMAQYRSYFGANGRGQRFAHNLEGRRRQITDLRAADEATV